MHRKILILSLTIVVIVIVGIYFLANSSLITLGEKNEPLYADSKPLSNNPEPILKGNAKTLTENDFKATKESVLDMNLLKEKNAEIKLAEYMTYAEYIELMGEKERSAEISEDRIMFVVQIYYPDGFDHVRVGLIENCMATGLYDAETGEYLGGSFETIEK